MKPNNITKLKMESHQDYYEEESDCDSYYSNATEQNDDEFADEDQEEYNIEDEEYYCEINGFHSYLTNSNTNPTLGIKEKEKKVKQVDLSIPPSNPWGAAAASLSSKSISEKVKEQKKISQEEQQKEK